MIQKELRRTDILQGNVFNMVAGVSLSVLGSSKVLLECGGTQAVRPSCMHRTFITAIECILADGRHLVYGEYGQL